MTAVWTLNVVAFWLMWLTTAYLNNLKSLAAALTFIDSHFFLCKNLGSVNRTLLRPRPSAWLGVGVAFAVSSH